MATSLLTEQLETCKVQPDVQQMVQSSACVASPVCPFCEPALSEQQCRGIVSSSHARSNSKHHPVKHLYFWTALKCKCTVQMHGWCWSVGTAMATQTSCRLVASGIVTCTVSILLLHIVLKSIYATGPQNTLSQCLVGCRCSAGIISSYTLSRCHCWGYFLLSHILWLSWTWPGTHLSLVVVMFQ